MALRYGFDAVKIRGGRGVRILRTFYLGGQFRKNEKCLLILGEPHEALGIQQVEVGSVRATLYYFFFRSTRAATRASLHVDRLPAGIASMTGPIHITMIEPEDGREESLARLLDALMPRFLSRVLRLARSIKETPRRPAPVAKWVGPLFPAIPDDFRPDVRPRPVLHKKFEIDVPGESTPDEPPGLGPVGDLVPFVPKRLRPKSLIGKTITEWTRHGGTYGMGGCGYVGLRIGESWLTIPIFGADAWLSLDGIPLSEYKQGSDETAHGSRMRKDRITGCKIVKFELNRYSMRIVLSNGSTLAIAESPRERPVYRGTGQRRAFTEEDDLRTGIFLAPTPVLWV